jgi:hypothetical protein
MDKRLLVIGCLCLIILLVLSVFFYNRTANGQYSIIEGDLAEKAMHMVASTQNNFRAQQNITALVEPKDLTLYRKLLPEQFNMPDHPMVMIGVLDNIEVGPWPLTPYQLAFIKIRCSYKGEAGWYCLTMPENKWVPVWAGRTMGHPKYLADSVALKQSGNSWTGEVVYKGQTIIRLEFTPEEILSPVWITQEWPMDGPLFLLKPPSIGPRVITVRSVYGRPGADSKDQKQPSTTNIKGSIRIMIGDAEPGKNLIPQGIPLYGTYSKAENIKMYLTSTHEQN